ILNPKKFQEFEIIEKIPVSHNTNIYRFALPKKNDVLGLPTGQHITISAEINGKEVTRSYTPISSDEDKGYFDLLIKHYPDGNISKHVNGLMAHQTIRVKGPKGKMIYVPNMSKKIGMICGGTGIAPMLQVLGTIVRNPEDFTEVSLLYANNAEEDILLKEDIDELAAKYPNFKVHYILSAPSANWEGSTGFITEDLIKEHLPAPSTHTRILICGPPPMVSAMKRATLALGFEKARPVSRLEDQVFVF
ncbi:NADH-cytochrome b5 reductase 1, partial [Nadsonia fulvescens var. elongata DSM 6958]